MTLTYNTCTIALELQTNQTTVATAAVWSAPTREKRDDSGHTVARVPGAVETDRRINLHAVFRAVTQVPDAGCCLRGEHARCGDATNEAYGLVYNRDATVGL